MKAVEIRRKFIEFFAQKGHEVIPSAPLVPIDDDSLLLINSGVATLKKYFDGSEQPANPRMVGSQKCIRTNDIENVGYTARHHTFFEMLGNFSIGDYFKKEAIHWAWEFLTSAEWLALDPQYLYVTIHPKDEDAYRIWTEEIGLTDKRIAKLESNFWDLGVGPSGPNSEIFYDRDLVTTDDVVFDPDAEEDRFLEIWNIVFSEYNHNPDDSYTPLPRKNIDTGMGFERIVSVIQNVATNYDTDLFQPIITWICDQAGCKYGVSEQDDVALKVIADHLRTIVFSIGDGIMPANDSRGYVIRRLLRRAMRYGRKIGFREPFLAEGALKIIALMGTDYPEIVSKQSFIREVIFKEEERFLHRLEEGLGLLTDLVAKIKQVDGEQITGKDAFLLYDTHGFPFDLTEDFAKEHGLTIDETAFMTEMENQKARARAAYKGSGGMKLQTELPSDNLKSSFIGYDEASTTTTVLAIFRDDTLVDSLSPGDKGIILLADTPFYAESGGQIADTGRLYNEQTSILIAQVSKGPRGEHFHQVQVKEGTVSTGDILCAEIDARQRQKIARNHTAVHLLHAALRQVLGEHVQQAGSLVTAEALRFDFSHLAALTKDELARVEQLVNEQIWLNTLVETRTEDIKQAKEQGAMALFGEKYGEFVRVVQIGDFSMELCGGTHVARTGEIGLFKILLETSVGASVRRIEAVVAEAALQHCNYKIEQITELANDLKCPVADVVKNVALLKADLKVQVKEKQVLQTELHAVLLKEAPLEVQLIKEIPVLVKMIAGHNIAALKDLAATLRSKVPEGIILLLSNCNQKAQLLLSISDSYAGPNLQANAIINELATLVSGRGGGRINIAQASGQDTQGLKKILSSWQSIIQKYI